MQRPDPDRPAARPPSPEGDGADGPDAAARGARRPDREVGPAEGGGPGPAADEERAPSPDTTPEGGDAAGDRGAEAGAGGGGDDAGEGPDGEAGTRSRARARREKPVSPVPPDRLEGAVEALLLASGDVLTLERLRDLLGLTSVIHVREALERIRSRWVDARLAVEVHEVAGGVRVVTRPEFAEYVRRLSRRAEGDRLTPTLLETLSVVAYRQPVPRVEVERIRGVQCGDSLRSLLERRLVKVVGRSDRPGRPLLYGTTRRFLEVFGLGSLKDLPPKGDLRP